jgi:hypothetical protein
LSDQYWVYPENSDLKWDKINFFTNDFASDVGEILFGKTPNKDAINLVSPDNTSDGWLRKKWIISDNKRFLVKGGSGLTQQEPFNEVIASKIMERMNIPHVAYGLQKTDNSYYSVCENFITLDTELVSAERIRSVLKKSNNDSAFTHFMKCCEYLGIPNSSDSINKMLTVDYIISNEDRHYNNFGAIRNAETLDWLGFAPIYDSGTSFWYQTPAIGSATQSKPFKDTHREQIKLVNNFSWYDKQKLVGISETIKEIFSNSDRIDTDRVNKIAESVEVRTKQIGKLCTEPSKAPTAETNPAIQNKSTSRYASTRLNLTNTYQTAEEDEDFQLD